ncbi:phage tail tube protein [Methylobacterium sp. ID0610]|uniref:phage tail tube protein n=1 Tax=Methylobacterium carpenticola TaxID=3344827 RepID=UPI003699AC3D
MTEAATLPFSGVSVKLESPTQAGTFEAPVGLTERSVSFSKETNSVAIPDSVNEDLAPFVARDVVSKSVSIAGKGVMARQSLGRWRAAFEADAPVRTRVTVAGTAAESGGHWEGLFHLTGFEVGAIRGERCTVTVALQSSGPVPFTAAA